jgi:hypothetical protein
VDGIGTGEADMKETRSCLCGRKMGETIRETANLFYQLDTKRRFFQGLFDEIQKEIQSIPKYDKKQGKRE